MSKAPGTSESARIRRELRTWRKCIGSPAAPDCPMQIQGRKERCTPCQRSHLDAVASGALVIPRCPTCGKPLPAAGASCARCRKGLPKEREGRAPRMTHLGHAAKRVLARFPRASTLHPLELINEGWLAWYEARRKGKTSRQAHSFAEHRMQAVAERESTPLVGETKALRGIRFALELPAGLAIMTAGHYGHRLTPGDWHALRTAFRRILTPQECQLLTRCVCERAGILEVARELEITPGRASTIRSIAIGKVEHAIGLRDRPPITSGKALRDRARPDTLSARSHTLSLEVPHDDNVDAADPVHLP